MMLHFINRFDEMVSIGQSKLNKAMTTTKHLLDGFELPRNLCYIAVIKGPDISLKCYSLCSYIWTSRCGNGMLIPSASNCFLTFSVVSK